LVYYFVFTAVFLSGAKAVTEREEVAGHPLNLSQPVLFFSELRKGSSKDSSRISELTSCFRALFMGREAFSGCYIEFPGFSTDRVCFAQQRLL
jgi:hypothetical protein